MKKIISKFAPTDGFPNLPIIDGLELSTINAGISKSDKVDVSTLTSMSEPQLGDLFRMGKITQEQLIEATLKIRAA